MENKSILTSVSIHVVVALAIIGFGVATSPMAQLPTSIDLSQKPKLAPYRPATGGASHDHLPASFGHPPPRVMARVFVPPQAAVVNLAPKLTIAPEIDVPPAMVVGPMIGDPNGVSRLLSGGFNGPGGSGDGPGTQVGPGRNGTGVYRYGQGGVTAPVPIHRVEPEYSEEARKAHAMGSVLVLVEVGPDGRVHNARIARSLGMGLDEKALEAVTRWLFRPGLKDGRPVTVSAQIEVSFHLL